MSLRIHTQDFFTYVVVNIHKYINNCPTRCNTKQSIYYSASSLCMFRVSTTPIIRNTQNCNYSLLYCAATSLQRGQASLATLCWPPYAVVHSFVFLTMGIMMPETCWDKRLIINTRLVASCWFLPLHCFHDARSQEPFFFFFFFFFFYGGF